MCCTTNIRSERRRWWRRRWQKRGQSLRLPPPLHSPTPTPPRGGPPDKCHGERRGERPRPRQKPIRWRSHRHARGGEDWVGGGGSTPRVARCGAAWERAPRPPAVAPATCVGVSCTEVKKALKAGRCRLIRVYNVGPSRAHSTSREFTRKTNKESAATSRHVLRSERRPQWRWEEGREHGPPPMSLFHLLAALIDKSRGKRWGAGGTCGDRVKAHRQVDNVHGQDGYVNACPSPLVPPRTAATARRTPPNWMANRRPPPPTGEECLAPPPPGRRSK